MGELSNEAQKLFDNMTTAKQREGRARALLNPLKPVVSAIPPPLPPAPATLPPATLPCLPHVTLPCLPHAPMPCLPPCLYAPCT